MTADMRYDYIRQKLNLLGYDHQSLPISAIPLVASILDDLIVTTEGLKNSKDQIATLLEEKNAWELGNEVYKCDNSKLLSEVNRLKVDLLNKERNVQTENAGKVLFASLLTQLTFSYFRSQAKDSQFGSRQEGSR